MNRYTEMTTLIRPRRWVAVLLVASTTGMVIPLPAQAGIVATDALVAMAPIGASAERERLSALLLRSDLRTQFEAKGVRPADVQARLDALSEAEVEQLAERIDTLPAGGDIVGAVVFVFIVLLITDILGLTKVFSFTKPIKR